MKYRVLEITPDKDGDFYLLENQQLLHGEFVDVDPSLTLLVEEVP